MKITALLLLTLTLFACASSFTVPSFTEAEYNNCDNLYDLIDKAYYHQGAYLFKKCQLSVNDSFRLMMYYGSAMSGMGNLNQAADTFRNGIEKAKKTNEKINKYFFTKRLADVNLSLGKTKDSLKGYLETAKGLDGDEELKEFLKDIYDTISGIYYMTGNFGKKDEYEGLAKDLGIKEEDATGDDKRIDDLFKEIEETAKKLDDLKDNDKNKEARKLIFEELLQKRLEILDLADANDYTVLKLIMYSTISITYRNLEDWDKSRDMFETGFNLAEHTGNMSQIIEYNLDMPYLILSEAFKDDDVNYSRAELGKIINKLIKYIKAAKSYAERSGYKYKMISVLREEAELIGDYEGYKSFESYKKALNIARQIGSKLDEASALYALGKELIDQGKYVNAQDNFESALIISEPYDSTSMRIWGTYYLGICELNIGYLKDAYAYFEEALGYAEEAEEIGPQIEAYTMMVRVKILQKSYEKAVALGEEGLKLAVEDEDEESQGFFHFLIGSGYSGQKMYEESVDHYQKAYDLYVKLENDYTAALVKLSMVITKKEKLGASTKEMIKELNEVIGTLCEDGRPAAPCLQAIYIRDQWKAGKKTNFALEDHSNALPQSEKSVYSLVSDQLKRRHINQNSLSSYSSYQKEVVKDAMAAYPKK